MCHGGQVLYIIVLFVVYKLISYGLAVVVLLEAMNHKNTKCNLRSVIVYLY